MLEKRKGLTGSQLKTIGLVLMILDHVGYFFVDYVPGWFRLLGRLSAPLFIFTLAEGFYHTSNQKKHIRNMYIWAAITMVGNKLLERVFVIDKNAVYLTNNIFLTFAVGLSIIYLIEKIDRRENLGLSIVGLIILSLVSLVVEGSIGFVGLILVFYFLREQKALKFGIFIGLSIIMAFLLLKANGWNLSVLWEHNQWFMGASVIFMLLYNGERGRGMGKYFFYIFYPTHVWLLYILKYALIK